MAIYHGRIPCKVTPSRSVVVVAASYGNDGQLRNVIISGNDQQHYLDLDFPDEGVYIVYQDRAIQVAAPPTNLNGHCPPRVFEWMKDTWNEFVDSGCCKPRSITAVPENNDGIYDETLPAKEQNNSEIDSDWDDLDIPYASSSTSNTTENEDYDLIDDLIEAEFPKLQKRNTPTLAEVDQSYSLTSHDTNVEENEDPAPVIIPPKTMTMARGFGAATEPEKSTPVRIGHDSSTSVIESKHTPKSKTALGTKRSYSDLVESEKRGSNPMGELSARIKQQKRDMAKPTIRYLHRYSPIIRPSFIRAKRVPPRLLVT
ncbi:hypothetical protein Daesc_005508 [Daldinia eschscholtzii]|uniref:Uncharacterized protein n=1 Tax=Daldinia eschscholtzii TaxID=292717 RepID=A0AAX6MKM4_9PEZI